MNATTCIAESKPAYRVSISERLRVAWRNRDCWKIRLALSIIRRAFKKDPGFRQSWHDNIAMPIHDASQNGFRDEVPGVKPVSFNQSNYLADALMKHLFE